MDFPPPFPKNLSTTLIIKLRRLPSHSELCIHTRKIHFADDNSRDCKFHLSVSRIWNFHYLTCSSFLNINQTKVTVFWKSQDMLAIFADQRFILETPSGSGSCSQDSYQYCGQDSTNEQIGSQTAVKLKSNINVFYVVTIFAIETLLG